MTCYAQSGSPAHREHGDRHIARHKLSGTVLAPHRICPDKVSQCARFYVLLVGRALTRFFLKIAVFLIWVLRIAHLFQDERVDEGRRKRKIRMLRGNKKREKGKKHLQRTEAEML